MFKTIAGMIQKMGSMTSEEVVAVVPGTDKKMVHRMRDAGYTISFDRLDGEKAYKLSSLGRKLCGDAGGEAARPRSAIKLKSVKAYDAPEMRSHITRQGSADHESIPSRIGNMLVYRDGRRVPIA